MITTRFEDRGETFGTDRGYEAKAQELVRQAEVLLREAVEYTSDPDTIDMIEDAVNTLPDIDDWNQRLAEG